jgi:2,5-diamino-6-(ribosylamino)-4(3H)-pyrimidinone 5'-phosphate reductase
LNEDPKLTVKSAEFRAERLRKGWPENPAKVGVITEIPVQVAESIRPISGVRQGAITAPLRQFLSSGPAQVYLFTTRCNDPEVLSSLDTAGVRVHTFGQDRVDLVAVFRILHEAGIRSVLVEGGGTLIAELFHLGLVDELTIYIAPKIFGGMSAPSLADGSGFLANQAPGLRLESVKKYDNEGGILVHYYVNHKE